MSAPPRPLLAVLLTVLALPAPAAEYFVAPAGDDAQPGTLDQPFATVARGQAAAAPGDTVWLRGGTYAIADAPPARGRRFYARVILLDKSGVRDKPIRYFAYKDERPVFDFSAVKPRGQRVHAFSLAGSWIHLRGFEVVGVQVTVTGHTQSICVESNGSHNVVERLSLHDGMGIGIYHVNGSDNLFLNCDAYNNHDPVGAQGRGGNVDGFGCHPTKGSTGNVFRGCRAWYNADDGYDCINAHEPVTFENCWALYSGLGPKGEKRADGNGFKAGGYGSLPASRLPDPIPRHVVRNCRAVGNKSSGFYANHHPGGGDWLNNSAYRNGTNFNMLGRLADNVTDVDGTGHVLRDNLSHRSRADLARIDAPKCTQRNNSWQLGLKLADADFLSVDESELTKPRQADGSLPVIRFMHPSAAGQLAGKGLGAFDGPTKAER